MVRVSARVGRNTRVSGGPVFWLLYALFVGPFHILGWLIKAVAAAASGFKGSRLRSDVPRDREPGFRELLADPARRGELMVVGGVLLVIVALAVVAAITQS